ncbi:MAG: M56 family metallopeptidase [Lachnospiraceae bacterium]|nr:M56 family metallopeptidase [Lachnospiraceae bacterium]
MRDFLSFICVYYATVLGFCTMASIPLAVMILVLRLFAFSRSCFAREAVWGLMLPALFCGKMKWYFTTTMGLRFFYRWYELCVQQKAVAYAYIIGSMVLAFLFLYRRMKLKRFVKGLGLLEENRSGYTVKTAPKTTASFSTGCVRPVIVLPEDLGKEERRLILRHEETHIRLGHMWIQLFWELFRVLMWPNLLLHIGERYLKRDLEDVCDKVTIYRFGFDPVHYAEILLEDGKRMNPMEGMAPNSLQFTGNDGYKALKERLLRILTYSPYKRSHPVALAAGTAVVMIASIVTLKQGSYARYNPMEVSGIFSEEKREMLHLDEEAAIITFDEDRIYIDCGELKSRCPQILSETKDIYVTVGGYYKIPGMGGGSDLGRIDAKTIRENDGVIAIEKYNGMDFWNRIIRLL